MERLVQCARASIILVLRITSSYRGTSLREKPTTAVALPTLDMYLPLSKFESIQRVSLTLRPGCNNTANLLLNTLRVRAAEPES